MYRVLIVEDDNGIAEGIKRLLSGWNMEAVCVRDFAHVYDEYVKEQPQLVLLDIGLPIYNGFYWCGEIRRVSRVPIIFISSAADNMNQIMAINMGADDFIAKPFDENVFLAKVQALLRRTYDFAESVPFLAHRGAVLDITDNSFSYNGEKLSLTKNESKILLVLMQNKGRIVSRDKLMEALWKTDTFVDENTLTVNVGRLRKKLEAAGLTEFIETKVGAGYIIP